MSDAAQNVPRRPTIGEILLRLGRISQEDVDRALTHQQQWGGYFGEALVALGLVAPGEVEWGLADQYDLPFVTLHPDAIDREVAVRVPAAWAREHLVLPVLRTGETVTAVLADPRSLGVLEEVRALTGAAQVEASLSTPEAIRVLIEAVHGEAEETLVSLARFLREALEGGAEEVGVSLTGAGALGWSRGVQPLRRALEGNPLVELRGLVSPWAEAGASVARWSARLSLPGVRRRVECTALGGGEEALEWAARISGEEPPPARADAGVRAAVALALRRGSALVAVPAPDAPHLPGLPAALLGRPVRTVHLSDREDAPDGVLHARVTGPLAEVLEGVAPFGVDALTLDVAGASPDDLEAARRAAPLVAVHLRGDPPAAAEFRLRLDSELHLPTWVYDAAD
jgi:hypothetical protein